MHSAEDWIRHLNLLPHPEGGYYAEVYRSGESTSGLPDRFEGSRNFCTAIYYMLRTGERSVFHRIKSDEVWHHYDGSALTIYVLDNGTLRVHRLGKSIAHGERPQLTIPANHWFAARVEHPAAYVLAGCTVSPGFDFKDFEIASRKELLADYPGEAKTITELT